MDQSGKNTYNKSKKSSVLDSCLYQEEQADLQTLNFLIEVERRIEYLKIVIFEK